MVDSRSPFLMVSRHCSGKSPFQSIVLLATEPDPLRNCGRANVVVVLGLEGTAAERTAAADGALEDEWAADSSS